MGSFFSRSAPVPSLYFGNRSDAVQHIKHKRPTLSITTIAMKDGDEFLYQPKKGRCVITYNATTHNVINIYGA